MAQDVFIATVTKRNRVFHNIILPATDLADASKRLKGFNEEIMKADGSKGPPLFFGDDRVVIQKLEIPDSLGYLIV